MGSRVSQLMGLGNKQQEVPPPPPVVEVNREEVSMANKIEAEKISYHLASNAELFRNKELKYEAKINNLKLKAKEYLQEGKTKEAKKILLDVARLQKQLQKVEVRRKLIDGQQEQIETHQMDREVIDVLEVAHEMTKEDLSGKLEDQIITVKQNQVLSDQINENMKRLVQNSQDQEQANDLFQQLQREVQRKNKVKIPDRKTYVSVVNIANNKQQRKQNNEVQQMLQEL